MSAPVFCMMRYRIGSQCSAIRTGVMLSRRITYLTRGIGVVCLFKSVNINCNFDEIISIGMQRVC